MKIQMEPTEHLVFVDGVECRVWNAITDRDTQCFVFVHRIGIPTDGTAHPDDRKDFEELFDGWEPTTITVKK
jgi:hypothetical protein